VLALWLLGSLDTWGFEYFGFVEILPCAAGPRAAAPGKRGLLGRNAAEREKKILCRTSGARLHSSIPLLWQAAWRQ